MTLRERVAEIVQKAINDAFHDGVRFHPTNNPNDYADEILALLSEGEPVAWMIRWPADGDYSVVYEEPKPSPAREIIPLYAHPPLRELTADQPPPPKLTADGC